MTNDDRVETLPPAVRLLMRVLDEGFAQGRTEVVDELFDPGLVDHQFGMAGAGEEALEKTRRAIADLHAMAPDIRYELQDWAQRGDVTWVRVLGTGTLTGPFFGPPSGKPFEITVIDVVRTVETGDPGADDGLRIAEHWGIPDRFALLAQSGALDRLRA
ncbi:MAG: ester cyclase [Schumannella sp.]